MSKEAEASAVAEATPAAARHRRTRWIVLGSAAVLAAGAAAGWYYLAPQDTSARAAAETPPVYLPLETFTVNLKPRDLAHYLQVGITLRLAAPESEALLKRRAPEVRNRILLLLSAKSADELLEASGKARLAEEISRAVNELLAPGQSGPVAETLFTAFILQ
jgi:flagellar FliL protein